MTDPGGTGSREAMTRPVERVVRTTTARSELMRNVRQSGTDNELIVRRALHALGARFRVNVRRLPGSPDIANQKRRIAIFVHGCFWHHHADCARGRIPKRNSEFWSEKLQRNVARDSRKIRQLHELGFRVLVLWECQLSDVDRLRERLGGFWFGDGIGSLD